MFTAQNFKIQFICLFIQRDGGLCLPEYPVGFRQVVQQGSHISVFFPDGFFFHFRRDPFPHPLQKRQLFIV